MVHGKRAFVVCGPEGSGTRVVTRCLIEAGCFGDDGHQQRLDGMKLGGRQGRIVMRRSAPHGGQWPRLGEIAIAMEKAGYEVTAIVCVREPVALARSQVAAGHVGSVGEAARQIERAYRHIGRQWAERRTVRLVVAPYEGYVLHPRAMRGLRESLGLVHRREDREPTWYDGNWRRYLGAGMERLGATPAALELLVDAGYWTLADLAAASDEELLRIPGIGEGRLAQIRAAAGGGELDAGN